ELLGRELGRLVRLDVRPQGEAVGPDVGGETVEVRLHAVQVHDRGGGLEIVQRFDHMVIRAATGAEESRGSTLQRAGSPVRRATFDGWEPSGPGPGLPG